MAEPSDNEKALMLKEEGNKLHQARDFEGASALWSRAIDEYGETADAQTIRVLKSNRAAASLELAQWEDVLNDCYEVYGGGGAPIRDLLSIKAIRRFCKAFLASPEYGTEEALLAFQLHQIAATKYQEAHPENTTVLFTSVEKDTLAQISALVKSKEEYEAINPPSEDRITYRYEVTLRSKFPDEEDATMRIRDIRHIFWYSGPSFSPIQNNVDHIERRAMIASTMVDPHEKDVIDRQNAQFGEGWGCVMCGGKATVVHHSLLDVLYQGNSRVEDNASAVCERDGFCWVRIVVEEQSRGGRMRTGHLATKLNSGEWSVADQPGTYMV